MTRRLEILYLMLCTAAAGCESSVVIDCTNIGCETGMVVMVQGSPPGPWTIDASAPGRGTHRQQCPAGIHCDAVHFPGFTPPAATITVTIGDRSSTSQVVLVRREVHPNGPNCGGCNQPLVTVAPPPP